MNRGTDSDDEDEDDDDDGDVDDGHVDHMSSSKWYKISGCGSSNPDLNVGTKMCESCAM